MRVLILALGFGVLAGPLPVLTGQQDGTALARLLEAQLARYPATAGVYVKHLDRGDEASVQGDTPFNSASVIKIPVMILAYRMADEGTLSLDERLEIRASDIRGGSGVFRSHDLGLNPTVRDVITQMIMTSDNTATDIMIGKVGGVDAVNRWLAGAGYTRTTLNQTTYELFRLRFEILDPAFARLTPQDVFALQTDDRAWASTPELYDRVRAAPAFAEAAARWQRASVEDEAFWLGTMTPRDTGRLLETIWTCTATSSRACGEMRRIMTRQQAGARRMPHFVTVPVAHKTGDIPPVVANDVGVVAARSGPVVMAFFTNDGRGLYGELEDHIGRTTQAVVDYFDGVP